MNENYNENFLWMKMCFMIARRTFIIIILDVYVYLHKIKLWKSQETEWNQGKQTNEAKIITANYSSQKKIPSYILRKPLSLVYSLFPTTTKVLTIFLICVKMDWENKLYVSSLSQKGVYQIIKNYTNIVVGKVML